MTTTETKNHNWKIEPTKEGIFPDNQVTHCILLDIRGDLRSIRKMAVFFTVLAVVGLVVGVLAAILK
jgi:hypothetical protein